MYNDKRILGFIPARGGSKGLSGKNVLPLLGKPLIAWTIEQAQESRYIDQVLVSTDSEEIAEISKNYGAEVPFMRPKELATDNAKVMDVLAHTLNWLEMDKNLYDVIILLQPTSPLRSKEDIDSAIEMLFSKQARSIVSVCETEHHPHWSNALPPDGCMKDFITNENRNKNRQELPNFYRLNGAIYLAFSYYVKAHGSFLGNGTYAYIMPRERSIDIDNEVDFRFAEFLMQMKVLK